MMKQILKIGLTIIGFTAAISHSANIPYDPDTTNFANPDRGYFITTTGTVSSQNLLNARTKGMTLIRKYYNIVSYASSDIPQSYLDGIAKDLLVLRQSGAKIIPRFQYNCGGCPTATLDQMLRHMDAITKVLRENSDVIAYIEMGFLGMCGEWHCGGGNILDKPTRQTVLNKMLEGVPDKMVALRFNRFKRDLYGNEPLNQSLAYSGTNQARTGAHNDCFMYSINDRGTYDDALTNMSIENQKSYLNLDNRYVVQGGESCDNVSYGTCERTLADLKRMHWDALNSTFFTPLIDSWETGGCNDDIKKLLGYRIQLLNSQLLDSVQPGKNFNGRISLKNIGWGKFYNYRGTELILRSTKSKEKFVVKLSNDVRDWTKTDSTISVYISGLIPNNVPEGPYQVYLNLPDTASRIHGNPAYSVRLANKSVWEDSTGYNSLLHTVVVSKNATVRNIHFSKTAAGLNLKSLRSNQGYTIEVTSSQKGNAEFEILNLNGQALYKQNIDLESNRKQSIVWKGSSSSVYLVRIKQAGNTQEIFTD